MTTMAARNRHTAKLSAARSRLSLATEDCPHWDYSAELPDGDHTCCEELRAADKALKKLVDAEESA